MPRDNLFKILIIISILSIPLLLLGAIELSTQDVTQEHEVVTAINLPESLYGIIQIQFLISIIIFSCDVVYLFVRWKKLLEKDKYLIIILITIQGILLYPYFYRMINPIIIM